MTRSCQLFAILCSLGWAAGCFQTPPIPSTDFNNSVLLLSPPNLIGGAPVDVSVLLQRGSGDNVIGSIVQVQAADCDVAQPTAPTGSNGETTGSVVGAPQGEHAITATVTVDAEQVTVPATTMLNVVPTVTSDANAVQSGTALNMQAVATLSTGQVNTAFSGVTHFVSSDPNATLPADAPMPASYHGVQIWPGSIILRTSGQQVVQILDTKSGKLLASEFFDIVPGPIGKLSFVSVPTSVAAGQPFTVSLAAETASGAALESYTGTVTFSSTDTHGSLPASTTYGVTDAGVRKFTFTLVHTGVQTLQVSDGIVVASASINVTPGPVAAFTVSGIPNPATALSTYNATLSATDAFGNAVSNFTGQVHFSSLDPTATLPPPATFSAGNQGVLSISGVIFRGYGPSSLTATATAQNGNTLTGSQKFVVHKVQGLISQQGENTGQGRTCPLIDQGNIKCFGDNTEGALGFGDVISRGASTASMGAALPYVSLGTGRTAVQVSSGDAHTCAVLDNGQLKCWGNGNPDGQLGLGDTVVRGNTPGAMGDALPAVALGTGRTAKQVTCGARHTCVLLDNATVKCWGHNDVGEIGYGDTITRGNAPGTMGDALPAVLLGSGRSVTSVAAGSFHTCAVLDDSSVKCWGYNYYGQLGVGDTADRGANSGTMGDYLPAVQLAGGALLVAPAQQHTCAVLNDFNVKCWGYNNDGELGLGDTIQRGATSSSMGSNLPELNLGADFVVSSVQASYYSSCALSTAGQVKCWGYNNLGQLGVGDTANRGSGSSDMGSNLPAVNLGTSRTALQLGGGVTHKCALLDQGYIRCWGDNSFGQLGTGTISAVGTTPAQLGDGMLPALLW